VRQLECDRVFAQQLSVTGSVTDDRTCFVPRIHNSFGDWELQCCWSTCI